VCVLPSMFGIGVDKRLIVRRDGIWSAVYVHGCVSLSNVGSHASTYTANFFLDGTSSLASWSCSRIPLRNYCEFSDLERIQENPHDMSFPHCPIATAMENYRTKFSCVDGECETEREWAVNAAWFSPPEVAD
jgi:hypothetical protein